MAVVSRDHGFIEQCVIIYWNLRTKATVESAGPQCQPYARTWWKGRWPSCVTQVSKAHPEKNNSRFSRERLWHKRWIPRNFTSRAYLTSSLKHYRCLSGIHTVPPLTDACPGNILYRVEKVSWFRITIQWKQPQWKIRAQLFMPKKCTTSFT